MILCLQINTSLQKIGPSSCTCSHLLGDLGGEEDLDDALLPLSPLNWVLCGDSFDRSTFGRPDDLSENDWWESSEALTTFSLWEDTHLGVISPRRSSPAADNVSVIELSMLQLSPVRSLSPGRVMHSQSRGLLISSPPAFGMCHEPFADSWTSDKW